MRQQRFDVYRRRCAGAARGRVLEVGVGSGLNLPFYGAAVAAVIGLDPSSRLLEMARTALPRAAVRRVALVEGSAESVPLDDGAVDTVLTTWTLCSIPNVEAALHEMKRVLAPSGRLLFVEHGRSKDAGVIRWQDRLTPMWKRMAGGCHLNRPIRELIERAGFEVESIDTGYLKGPKPMTFIYQGSARPR
jgi:ubiquinone/menaquinone biosynthesis C-methylase UbiE